MRLGSSRDMRLCEAALNEPSRLQPHYHILDRRKIHLVLTLSGDVSISCDGLSILKPLSLFSRMYHPLREEMREVRLVAVVSQPSSASEDIDMEEKNHQAPLMRSIYQQAKQVMMWFGEEGQDGEHGMSVISTWGETAPQLDVKK